jgi:hypothetical protein
MKKLYPPDRKLDLQCQGPLCKDWPGTSTYYITLEQTQAEVPSPYGGGKLARWTLIKLKCSRCGFTPSVGLPLSKGCGWEQRLRKEGVRRKDPKQRKVD